MSSQDSEGESYVVDYIANSKVYGDVEHYGWTTEEEEDYDPKRKEETSSDEDGVPLPQPGDMHIEFKKSSLPNKAKKPKIQFIPFRPLQENKQDLCKKVLELEWEIRELKDENSVLKSKLRKKDKPSTSSPPAPSSSTKENWVSGMGTHLGLCQPWGRCPGIVSSPLSFAITFLSLIHSYLLL